MANFPRFMIAQNPMADAGTEYVLHTGKPRFLARRVFDGFEIVDEIDPLQDYANKEALMHRMKDWYIAYKTWQKKVNEQRTIIND